ncbi:F-box/LRR-repeat protein 5 [Conger conger]|uniref:F-box/LRR-repeat protein 5 n=1 Tax=Conger conger TaxID=82655 RepID=UPI002A5A6794|nr:F-box/LRR-repeat protein 5 [Conger conger]
MAPFPDEVDVFTGPHWRMKQLVGLYCEKLSKTNFSNNQDFRSFLQSLCATFTEFKMHEQIENDYIICLLQQRSNTVYNVHSDNKLSDMLSLFHTGLCSVKNECEQLNYARQLKERLEAFTQDFLPHMKEEEEVFQPMLMEYFTYEELKDIKKTVMAQHCRCPQGDSVADCGCPEGGATEVLKGLSLWSQRAFKYSAHEKAGREPDEQPVPLLPPEVLLKVFRYLGPDDLCRCGQVCTVWSHLARTGSLWKHLYPLRWARGRYCRGPPEDPEQEPDEEWEQSREEESRAWDEDADIDESEGALEDSSAIGAIQREKKVLHGIIQNLLPAVGPSVRSIVLAYSAALSSKMVRQILSLCPNLTHLDLTQTDITDSAFDSWACLGACHTLEHLDLSGCEKITDVTLKRLSLALGDLAPPTAPCAAPPTSLEAEPGGRQALVFRRRPGGGRSHGPAHVWLLDSAQLADIEDAGEWRRRGGASDGGRGLWEPLAPPTGACCCRRSRRRGLAANAASYWPQLGGVGEAGGGGHASCCGGQGLRTVSPTRGGAEFRTKRAEEAEPPRPRPRKSSCRRLRLLSLSGCYQVTDLGLRALAQRGGLPRLEHLNLSGCLFATESGLQELVTACPSLNDQHFYYCDNINGPHADTASGCQNLQCGFRACCRSGE